MFIAQFKSIISSVGKNRFMIYQMIESFDNPEFVKALQKDGEIDIHEKINTFYKALGKGMYVQHLVNMKYVNPLTEVKQKIEDYWNDTFVDEWGRKNDKMFSDEEDYELSEKDFHTYLKWSFSNEEGTDVTNDADIPAIILAFWETNTDIQGALMGGLVNLFNPTILSKSEDGEMKEMSDSEKKNYSLDQKLKQMEDSFHLIQYKDLCKLAIHIAENRSDPKELYELL